MNGKWVEKIDLQPHIFRPLPNFISRTAGHHLVALVSPRKVRVCAALDLSCLHSHNDIVGGKMEAW